MSDEQIPCWIRKLSSFFFETARITSRSRTLSYPNSADHSPQRMSILDPINPKAKYQTIYQQEHQSFSDQRRNKYCHSTSNQNKSNSPISKQIFRNLSRTSIFIALSLICSLSIHRSDHNSATSLPLGIGGVLPTQTTSRPMVSPYPMGRQQWLDNKLGKLGSNPLADLTNTAMRGFCHPLQGKGFLSQGNQGGTHQGRMEYAYDFGVPIGMPVYAMQSGRVIGIRDVYPDQGGKKTNAEKFNFIWLEHSNGVRSAYIHLQQNFRHKVAIKLYDWVQTGQLIGLSGNSGWSSAPHLHVEVHQISHSGFGQTLPFVIASTCYARPVAKAGLS